jgi:hypothetical protein
MGRGGKILSAVLFEYCLIEAKVLKVLGLIQPDHLLGTS